METPSPVRSPHALLQRWSPARGSGTAFVWYLLTGAVLLTFLFGTVHRRSVDEIRAYNDRFHRVVQVWIENGYLKHGGLAFTSPGDADPQQTVWRSSSMAFLQGAHALERIHYLFRGRYSYRLMVLHNQAVVLLTAALIGLLGMRMARRLGLGAERAFVLGLACQAVYQTFPQNLYYYWELLPTAAVSLVAVAWLLVEESAFESQGDQKRPVRLRSALVFLLVWIEPVSAILMIAAFLFTLFILAPDQWKRVRVLGTIITPAACGLILLALQVLWVRYRFPHLNLEGSSFLFRSGLDGSTQYVQGHVDLLTRKWPTPGWPINHWKALFISGVMGVAVVLALRLITRLPLRSAVFVLTAALGLYVPLAFAFFQAVAIHPYGYDVYLVFPLILALFAVAPAALEATTKHTGLFVLASLFAAWSFAWVHLRTYAMQFPLLK